jgi:hypothetical protein
MIFFHHKAPKGLLPNKTSHSTNPTEPAPPRAAAARKHRPQAAESRVGDLRRFGGEGGGEGGRHGGIWTGGCLFNEQALKITLTAAAGIVFFCEGCTRLTDLSISLCSPRRQESLAGRGRGTKKKIPSFRPCKRPLLHINRELYRATKRALRGITPNFNYSNVTKKLGIKHYLIILGLQLIDKQILILNLGTTNRQKNSG